MPMVNTKNSRSARKAILVSEIIFDPAYYPRKEVDQNRVNLFCDLMKAGEYFRPIRVVLDNSRGKYIALDGEHRLSAINRLGKETIEAEIHNIFPDQWRITAAAWNFKSSKPLTRDELKNIVTLAWRKDKVPEDEIARVLGCSERYVHDLLKDARAEQKQKQHEKVIELKEKGLSLRKIAQKTGLSKSKIDRICKSTSQNDCPIFTQHVKMGPREIPANNSERLVPSSPAPSRDWQPHVGIEAEKVQAPGKPTSQPDPEVAAKAETERNDEIIKLTLCNQPKISDALSISLGLNRPGNTFPGLGIEIPKPPRPSIDMTLPEHMIKEQIKKIYPTATNQMGSYDLCTDADKKALRIMELVKFFKQDIDVIKIDTGASKKFIFKVMIAAFILAASPKINDEYTAEVAARLDMPLDLAETIDDYGIRRYKTVLYPVAPHISAWIDKNLSPEAVSLILKIVEMNKLDFMRFIDGKPIPVPVQQDFPKEKVELLKLGVSYFRQYRDMIRTQSFSNHSLVFPQKWVAKMQIVLNEISDITKNLYINDELKTNLKKEGWDDEIIETEQL